MANLHWSWRLLFPACLALLHSCKGPTSSPAKDDTSVAVVQESKESPTNFRYLPSLGIQIELPNDIVELAFDHGWKASTKNGSVEYMIVWEKNLKPSTMEGAFLSGLDDGNGHMSKAKRKPEKIGEKASIFEFETTQLNNAKVVSQGYQIHDWSYPKGVLVLSVNTNIDQDLKGVLLHMYQSIKIPDASEVKSLEEKEIIQKSQRNRSPAEQELYNMLVGKALVDIETYESLSRNAGAPANGTIRIELCNNSFGHFLSENLRTVNSPIVQPKMTLTGAWDIITEKDGLRLTITESGNMMGRWKILAAGNDRFIVDDIEFIALPQGVNQGPVLCE